jgi:hypothetical protein
VTKALAIVSMASLVLVGCGTSFDPPSLVESVRILAIAADQPYPAPGARVSMTALAFDGRAQKPAPMGVFWVPAVCPNPPGDSYFACYSGLGEILEPGVDVTSALVRGERFSFDVPEDIITTHPPPEGGARYGMVTVLAFACAGHVQLVQRGADTVPPAPPLGCFDDAGTELGPDASVFAYAQVFSFADGRANANPAIQGLTFAGIAVDPTAGITVAPCPTHGNCPTIPLDTVVPGQSWELDPGDQSSTGTPLHEEIWVDYFVTAGKLPDSALLYDASAGKLPSSAGQVTAPTVAGDQSLWAVVRDNRGGVSWLGVTMHVKP